MFSFGTRYDFLPENHVNPVKGIKQHRENKRTRFMSNEELSRLGRALKEYETIDPLPVAAIRLLLLTGARVREVLWAKWSYIDFDRGLLNLPKTKTGPRSIRLSAAACDILVALPRFGAYVFPGQIEGRPREGLKHPWHMIRIAAGLGDLHLHDLRHAFASLAVSSGVSLPEIQALLGHASPQMTSRYSHLVPDAARIAVESIGDAMTKALDQGKA